MIRHFEFRQFNIKFGINVHFIQIRTFEIFHVHHIGSAVLNFENLPSYLDSVISKTFTLEILRDSEVFVLNNIFGMICSFSPDSEAVTGGSESCKSCF